MRKTNLQCIFIGSRSQIYSDLISTMTSLDANMTISPIFISPAKNQIQQELKKIQGVGLVFIADEVSFSLALLSDLIWQNSPDLNVVLLTEKTASTNITKAFNNTYFSKLLYKKDNANTKLCISFLFQIIQAKEDFRCCKGLLGISERRSRWLVDSNRRAIAYISRDMHLYANPSYLKLLKIDTVNKATNYITKIPVRDLINPDEHRLFDEYLKNQLRSNNVGSSLIISFRTINGKELRVKIIVFIALFQGKKCFQMWVEPVHIYKDVFPKSPDQKIISNENDTIFSGTDGSQLNLRSAAAVRTKERTQSKVPTINLLQEIIANKKATLQVTKLDAMEDMSAKVNYIVSLKMNKEKKDHVNKLLSLKNSKMTVLKQNLFWDQLVIRLLLNTLAKKTKLNNKLFITLTDTALKNEMFTKWLFRGLETLGKKASFLVVMINAENIQFHEAKITSVIEKLSSIGCKISFGNFSASNKSLALLKIHRPDYISLSKSWLKTIDKNDSREILLGRFIRQFESKNIKVIAPCNYNKNLNKIFTLSGVSFCHGKL